MREGWLGDMGSSRLTGSDEVRGWWGRHLSESIGGRRLRSERGLCVLVLDVGPWTFPPLSSLWLPRSYSQGEEVTLTLSNSASPTPAP